MKQALGIIALTLMCSGLVSYQARGAAMSSTPSPDLPSCQDTLYVFENRKVSYSDQGRYLLKTWATCINGCHTPRINPQTGQYQPDRGRFDTARAGAGGYKMHRPDGTCVMTPNITPEVKTGLGTWSLAEIERAIAACESKDGRKLGPPMICGALAKYARWQDVHAVACFVTYGLKPVENDVNQLAQKNDCVPEQSSSVNSQTQSRDAKQ